jgi:hypothetical protein
VIELRRQKIEVPICENSADEEKKELMEERQAVGEGKIKDSTRLWKGAKCSQMPV